MHNYKWLLVFNKLRYLTCCYILICLSANAVVNVENTRVIFNADSKIVPVSLSNSEKQPTLVQLWIDDGDMMASPETIKSPIVISPPVFKMQPGEVRSINLLLPSRAMLSKEHESLYWLNIYQIPPNTTKQLPQKIILPLRIRLKIFIRPQGLRELQEQDGKQLEFRLNTQKSETILKVKNPTPWYINLNGIVYDTEAISNMMLPPQSEISVVLTKQISLKKQISFNIINDQGNYWQYVQSLQ